MTTRVVATGARPLGVRTRPPADSAIEEGDP